MEDSKNVKEINGTAYVLKLFPTSTGLRIAQRLERAANSDTGILDPEMMQEVITKGASIGSVDIDAKKFDTHFRGKYADVFELYAEVLKFNKLIPEASEGNENDSEE